MMKLGGVLKKLKLEFLSPYLPFVGGILLSLLLVGLVVVPKVTSLSKLTSEKEEVEEELSLLKEKSGRLGELLANQSVLKTNLKLVDSALPSSEDVPTLMTQIQQIATESGVKVSTLHFGGIKKGKEKEGTGRPYKEVSLQAEAEGAFANLSVFLRNLEMSSRVVVVESLKFALEDEKEGAKLVSTLGLSSFYLGTSEEELLGRPLRLDLSSPSLLGVLEKLKRLRVYEPEVVVGGGGKEDPFAR